MAWHVFGNHRFRGDNGIVPDAHALADGHVAVNPNVISDMNRTRRIDSLPILHKAMPVAIEHTDAMQ